jgi:hypothetical protein
MRYADAMARVWPGQATFDREALIVYVDAYSDCAQACTAKTQVQTLTRLLVQTCATACKTCGDECERHGAHGMKHCRICVEA